MKARFIGDPAEPKPNIPDEFESFGLVFPKGKWVDTSEIKNAAARKAAESKLAGNSHFEVKGDYDHHQDAEAEAKPAKVVEPLPKHPAVATPDDGAATDGGKK